MTGNLTNIQSIENVGLCECGCGSLVKARYVHGHNKAHLGHKHTEEMKKKMSELKRNTPLTATALEIMRRSGLNSKTKFKKGHKSYTDGKNLINWQAGKMHWNWKGGITDESHLLRQTKKYKEWRDKIYLRDDFTCQICKKRGVYLEADHYPIPWCVLFKEKNYKIMWDISNGRTLCRKCHDKTKQHWRKYYEKS